MTQLIQLDNVSLSFGLHPLLDNAKLQINTQERVCLIGRNGAGKSSLLKLIAGDMLPDGGKIWRKPQLRMATLAQELPRDVQQTVYDYVAEGLADIGNLLAQYHHLIAEMNHESSEQQLNALERIQAQIEAKGGWQFENKITSILTRMQLNPDATVASLSGGWQRRAALARALIIEPELLLLDEPTNHLDIEMIEWLEKELLNSTASLIFITHDRALLQRLATRIIELDRGNLTSWPGDYANFLRHKAELLQAEEKANALFDKKLSQEEKWIRQGIKARRTRNEGRVRALKSLRVERAKRREVQGKVNIQITEAEKSGALVVEAKDISHGFSGKKLIDHFSMRIMRQDRIGLVGPNGVGKSTLLNILLGNLVPQEGELNLGTKLQIAYFDQLRLTLDKEKTVRENVVEGSDVITVNGKDQHVMTYLNQFLFAPERAMTPVKALSGGECNRLLLAKLFSQPANLLVMDEPTNDLDIETLELLEELLLDYHGTLLLVSHDRSFLDNVVTSVLAFGENGKLTEYVGGYQDYLRARSEVKTPEKTLEKKVEKVEDKVPPKRQKLSYKEQRELNELPQKIASLEAKRDELQAFIAREEFYQSKQEVVTTTLQELQNIEKALEACFERWVMLEEK